MIKTNSLLYSFYVIVAHYRATSPPTHPLRAQLSSIWSTPHPLLSHHQERVPLCLYYSSGSCLFAQPLLVEIHFQIAFCQVE